MFGNLGLPEILLLAIVGLVVFGPERLPRAVSDAAKMIRQLRAMSRQAMNDVKGDLGPEFANLDLRSLHPRRIITDHLFAEDDDAPADMPENDLGKPTEVSTEASLGNAR
jgi:sec-independent protein translocase protein TatB